VGAEALRIDVAIVGAGFAGLNMLHRARKLGLRARVYEQGGGVGGTWYWNRYPGARCDVESLEYSYSFDEALQQEWKWTERYAGQPEILRYLEHVAERFDLRKDIEFNCRITSATFDGKGWLVESERSKTKASFLVMATGCLSSTNHPAFEGLPDYTGKTYHTGRWPHEGVDFTGLRVGIIGTGSSSVQSIPIIAAQAKELVVFQRTATYSVPARNAPLDPAEEASVKADYAGLRARNRQMINGFGSRTPRSTESALAATREEHARAFEGRWQQGGLYYLGAFGDLILDARANDLAAEFVRGKIRETVRDPAVAKLLEPRQPIGCKRLCIDSGYFETFNRPNVRLVDVNRAPIERFTPRCLRAGGEDFAFDAVVFATGFDAMTGALNRIDLRGRNGVALADKWRAGPLTYLGLGVAGFPNLFIIAGPGSPSVLTNMVTSIEQHVDWIAGCLAHLRARGHATIEASPRAEEDWVAHVNEVASRTVYPGCNSWYLGANIPGKTRVFMPLLGFPAYAERCAEVAAQGYEGFVLT
jgi:cyclohexanone monooxygenase